MKSTEDVQRDLRKGCEGARGKMVTVQADDVLKLIDALEGKVKPEKKDAK